MHLFKTKSAAQCCMSGRAMSHSLLHSGPRLCCSGFIRSASKLSKRHTLAVTKAARPESLPQLQPGVVEAGSSEQQQQTLDAFVAEQPADGTSMFSDMSVEDPPTFEDLGIDKLLVSCLAESGIELPSPIQEAAMPQLLAGHNAAVQSYTGSGKTLAYLLPAMTLALRRAEATYRRQQAAAAAGASSLAEQDQYSVQVLVVAPSQELAMQICRIASGLLPREGRSAVQQAIGGANVRRQAEALAEKQPLVVVGTPGRLADLMRMGALRLHRCPILIMDEADQLLGDVYAADMAHIVEHCGKKLGQHKVPAAGPKGGKGKGSRAAPAAAADAADGAPGDAIAANSSGSSSSEDEGSLLLPIKRQTVLVSATLWAGVLGRFAKWCPDPQFLTMGNAPTWSNDDGDADAADAKGSEGSKTWGWGAKGWEGPASVVQQGPKTQGMAGGAEGSGLVPTLPPNLEHRYMVVNPQHKADAVRRAMYALEVSMGLGFMNWQQRLKDVAGKVAAKKIEVGQLHGDMTPLERAAVLDAARKGAFQLLLVSDVAARGLDMPQVDVVFNIELPSNAAHYAHRAGRTGRMGAPGLVMTLVAPGERFVVERLSKKLGVPIMECHLAAGEVVLGPPPVKDKKKKKVKEQQQEQQQDKQQQQQEPARSAQVERQQSNSKASSSSSSAARPVKAAAGQAAGAAARPLTPATAAAAAAARFDAGADDDDSDDGEYVIDEDDDVAVEGDEPVEAVKQRIKHELQSELEEIKAEKAAARQQRYERQQADGSRQQRQVSSSSSRKWSGPKPKGTPAEAAAMAMALIVADDKAKKSKSKSKLPAEVLEAMGGASDAAAGAAAGKQKPKRQQQKARLQAGRAAASGRRRSTSTSQ